MVARQVPLKMAGPGLYELDKSLDVFFREFCKALVEEANSGPKPRELESYVDLNGRESPGFLHYNEFKELYY